MKSEIADVPMRVVNWTNRALLAEAEDESEHWLPFSLVEIEGRLERGRVVTVSMPQWMAEERGLV